MQSCQSKHKTLLVSFLECVRKRSETLEKLIFSSLVFLMATFNGALSISLVFLRLLWRVDWRWWGGGRNTRSVICIDTLESRWAAACRDWANFGSVVHEGMNVLKSINQSISGGDKMVLQYGCKSLVPGEGTMGPSWRLTAFCNWTTNFLCMGGNWQGFGYRRGHVYVVGQGHGRGIITPSLALIDCFTCV